MLSNLSIKDIVLIRDLALDFSSGLSVVTGETGAGKSILLDSLGLATGARADAGLVRSGAPSGQVTACFDPIANHPVFALLTQQDIAFEAGDALILRRSLSAEGRSRGWINDQPVSVALLREVGKMMVEVHGQHDDRGLVEVASHRALLDDFAENAVAGEKVNQRFEDYRTASKALDQAQAKLATAREEEEYIRHAVSELEQMKPIAGEESELAGERTRMMQGERIAEDLSDFAKKLAGGGGVDVSVRGVLRRMERLGEDAQTLLQGVIAGLDRASIELEEARLALDSIRSNLEFSPAELESTEERLFELRAIARKHNCQVDDLPELLAKMSGMISELDAGDETVRRALVAKDLAWQAFEKAVLALRASRQLAGGKLDKAVCAELPPLKLAQARFRSNIELLDPSQWNGDGGERVSFEVSTNPSTAFGGLFKIASGGEQARFILALKVVLASKGSVPVLVFDEVDQGIGGATASAVGERLERLAKDAQVLVVTHSPQVAALGGAHYRIEKSDSESDKGLVTTTDVTALNAHDRQEEIARMLAGSEVTTEARAAAIKLMVRGVA